ncbi:MAG: RNA 3'-phosphate cyclase [Candidatus Rokubacteria bacterium]|nr:RNA 3'-phosphate cyclase [Candidatus Rokubacteria bacterium]
MPGAPGGVRPPLSPDRRAGGPALDRRAGGPASRGRAWRSRRLDPSGGGGGASPHAGVPGRADPRGAPRLLTLDGSHGEGGGQILRTALALAVARRVPLTLTRIRARRPKPGLQPQHLTVVRALAAISDAEVKGDGLDSTELTFLPRTLRGGSYRFDVGAVKASAGSVSLLFQALLLPLALAPTESRLTRLGGTHVPWSPPVHYLTEVFLPALRQIGVEARLTLKRWGWYPAGGGEVEATIVPARQLSPFRPQASGTLTAIRGLSAVSRLPRSIAERQRERALERLSAAGLAAEIAVQEDATARGPGTLLFLAVPGRAGFSALGRRGVPAERVADEAVEALLAYRGSGALVDDRLADQLMPFLALAREASLFTSPALSSHLQTAAWVVQQFLPTRIDLDAGPPARVRITPPPAA